MRLGWQVRAIPGVILGWDMVAALALADALGLDRRAVAEFLPEIEAAAMPKINEQMRQDSG